MPRAHRLPRGRGLGRAPPACAPVRDRRDPSVPLEAVVDEVVDERVGEVLERTDAQVEQAARAKEEALQAESGAREAEQGAQGAAGSGYGADAEAIVQAAYD